MIKNKLRGEKGQAMIEFALILPLFVVFMLFIMDVGWITYQKVLFNYTSRHITWELKLSSYDDWVMAAQMPYDIVGHEANDLLKHHFLKSNNDKGNRLDDDQISVRKGSISIYPGKRAYKYDVPEDNNYAQKSIDFDTTTYEIMGEITYRVRPLTPIANHFFEEGILLKNNLYKVRRGGMKTKNVQR